jgi:5,10-methylenetetrahydromethanopterin reductase
MIGNPTRPTRADCRLIADAALPDMIPGMELWLHTFAFPGRVAETARQAERWGFTGLLIADSQNLTGDIWVELALAAAATSSLRLGPGVTNPVTRRLAVTASAAATLQAETDGRATLGFARGDSALSQIGLTRLSVNEFEHALEALQRFLSGQEVQLNGTTSAIRWLAGCKRAKVPVHVAATGPRTIQAAARHAEGVDLTVGTERERVQSGVAAAREAGPAGLVMGAYVNVAVDPDRDRARELVRGSAATFARFSAEAGEADAREFERVARDYHRDQHGQSSAAFAKELDHDFIDRFTACGTADDVRARLAVLADCGLDRIIVVPCSVDTEHEALRRSNELFAREVLPELVG